MASSNSVDFSVSRDDIISQALQDIGVMAATDTTSSTSFTNHSAMVAIKLNMLVKQWSGQSDFAPGLKMWSRKRGYLFLCGGQAVYTLGPTVTDTGTTNKWASSYVTTTVGANEAAGQTAITVASITGISDTDRIGIELDDGTMHWTTVNGSPTGTTVTITASLASAAASGNRIFAYATTAQGRRPLEILTASLRSFDSSNVPTDVPIDAGMLIGGYEAIASKAADSDLSGFYYEQTLTNGTAYLNCEPSDVAKIIRVVYLSPIEDFDAASDTPDYDQNWYLPLALGTAYLIAPTFGRSDLMASIKVLRDEALGIARNANPETSDLYFMCDP
jgi:hypothetical protein